MPFVYRYTDRNDGKVKYVGIIKKDSNFPGRFAGHKSDDWADEGDWKIEFFRVPTQSDAEMLEAHLIAFYKTYMYNNKSKGNWGLCSYAPKEKDLQWEEFNDYTGRVTSHGCISFEIEYIKREQRELLDKLDDLYGRIKDLRHEFTVSRRASIREWARERAATACNSRLNCRFCHDRKNCTIETSIADCLMDYQQYAEMRDMDLFEFVDIEDFKEALEDTPETTYHVKGDSVSFVLVEPREEEEAC